jgi:hypothetical protein
MPNAILISRESFGYAAIWQNTPNAASPLILSWSRENKRNVVPCPVWKYWVALQTI